MAFMRYEICCFGGFFGGVGGGLGVCVCVCVWGWGWGAGRVKGEGGVKGY